MAKPNSKWRSGNPFRVSDKPNTMQDGRWVKLQAGTRLSRDSNHVPVGLWIFVEDTCSERTWIARRRESLGWHKGARVRA